MRRPTDLQIAATVAASGLLAVAAALLGQRAFGVGVLVVFTLACGLGAVRAAADVATRGTARAAREAALLGAIDSAAAVLQQSLREDDPYRAEEAFDILAAASARARGEATYQDIAGTEWPLDGCSSCEKEH